MDRFCFLSAFLYYFVFTLAAERCLRHNVIIKVTLRKAKMTKTLQPKLRKLFKMQSPFLIWTSAPTQVIWTPFCPFILIAFTKVDIFTYTNLSSKVIIILKHTKTWNFLSPYQNGRRWCTFPTWCQFRQAGQGKVFQRLKGKNLLHYLFIRAFNYLTNRIKSCVLFPPCIYI